MKKFNWHKPNEFKILAREYSLTTDEIISITGIDKFTFRNWLKRKTIDVGKKHRTGRWLFCLVDVIKISSMVDLVHDIKMRPELASRAVDSVIDLFDAYIEKSIKYQNLNKKYSPHMPLENYRVLIVTHRGGEDISLHRYVRGQTDIEKSKAISSALRLTHIDLAAGFIIEDAVEQVKGVIDELN